MVIMICENKTDSVLLFHEHIIQRVNIRWIWTFIEYEKLLRYFKIRVKVKLKSCRKQKQTNYLWIIKFVMISIRNSCKNRTNLPTFMILYGKCDYLIDENNFFFSNIFARWSFVHISSLIFKKLWHCLLKDAIRKPIMPDIRRYFKAIVRMKELIV